jgi:hypothetical protein
MDRSYLLAAAAVVSCVSLAYGDVRITEFMSEGQGLTGMGSGANRQREFFELTNLGNAPVDVSTWSYNDNNANDPHNFGPFFGSLAAGESVIFTQMTAENFRSYWQLPTSVRVFSYAQLSNLGNADTINIYNSFVQEAANRVDSLTYGELARGSGISRNRPWDGGTGQYINDAWVVSAVGDNFQSRLAPNPIFPAGPEYIDLANPGVYVPAPSALGMIVAGGVLVSRRRRA